ncbi:uncharacterized protein N7469_006178 [Penicillium citrinum]|uniref:Uncharacterized protein n=1 Tax=Penicillium citrinum TaxID=5077 RepID=A0A9W9NXU2_PENCI|nr:uncharacterized protein N7469_006178 [Penicillium citrinum]KAJ5231590.1 hypothetical protein N7469_006178 [Penicillium citrinum]
MSQYLAYLYMFCRSGIDTIVHAFDVFVGQQAIITFNRIKDWIEEWINGKPEIFDDAFPIDRGTTMIAQAPLKPGPLQSLCGAARATYILGEEPSLRSHLFCLG